MTLTYTSSNGQTFNLRGDTIRTRTAAVNDYRWLPQIVSRQYGAYVKQFNKNPLQFSILLDIAGSISDRMETLNELHEAFDHDILSMTPGRIHVGDYYLDCYITFSSTFYKRPWTQNEILVYAPYPFWQKDHVYQFSGRVSPTVPQYVTNPGAGSAEFILTIYGPVDSYNDCFIWCDSRKIGCTTQLLEDDKVVINSREKTVTMITPTETIDAFTARLREGSIFERVKPGDSLIEWSGEMTFDMVICEERSEPLWT